MLSVPGELCWCVGLLSQAGCGGEVAVCMAGVMVLRALKPSKAVLGSSLTKIHKNRAVDTVCSMALGCLLSALGGSNQLNAVFCWSFSEIKGKLVMECHGKQMGNNVQLKHQLFTHCLLQT